MRELSVESLRVRVHDSEAALADDAAALAATSIRSAVAARGWANIVLATGNSQLTFVARLGQLPDVPWSHVRLFHMDEYVGVGEDHPASFARYMRHRVADVVGVGEFHPFIGTADPVGEAARYSALLRAHPTDLCVLGIGENGHLAFNDPPADLDDPELVKEVTLDEDCKRQQVGEGHFASLADVPPTALTITVPALLAAGRVIGIAPESRKAPAVKRALTGEINGDCPASALRRCAHAVLLLDELSASLL